MMSNETKRDVFEDALRALKKFGEQGSSWEMAYDDLSARYAAALPDDMPVIPKAVEEYIKRQTDNPPDLNVENWIIDHGDTFTRAWLLGVWRVDEGTDEIVKQEAEK